MLKLKLTELRDNTDVFHYQSKIRYQHLSKILKVNSTKMMSLKVSYKIGKLWCICSDPRGVQGLVHISEIAHKHIGTPGEVLRTWSTSKC